VQLRVGRSAAAPPVHAQRNTVARRRLIPTASLMGTGSRTAGGSRTIGQGRKQREKEAEKPPKEKHKQRRKRFAGAPRKLVEDAAEEEFVVRSHYQGALPVERKVGVSGRRVRCGPAPASDAAVRCRRPRHVHPHPQYHRKLPPLTLYIP